MEEDFVGSQGPQRNVVFEKGRKKKNHTGLAIV
jgi:hypothetical protein